jgi:hypothetical protein
MSTALQRLDRTEGVIGANRQRRLEELPGWTWNPYADRWEEGFSRLLKYVEDHGNAGVPRSYTVDSYNLGQWIITQRYCHRKGTLDRDRKCRLQVFPGWT